MPSNSVPAYELKHHTSRKITRGSCFPLGATLNEAGANFAVFSQPAAEMYLLLFDRTDGLPTDIIRLENRDRYIWHAQVEGIRAGQLYAYKARGEFNPKAGLRFNENKLLLDPYARALTGKCRNVDNLLLAYDANSPERDLSFDTRDNTSLLPKCIVVEDTFDWQGDQPPDLPLEKLIIYEVHLKGFTAHPSSGVCHPGTYLGFVEKIPHLANLGINAVELLPIHENFVEDFLLERGLTNYWGYNTLGFFAPESSYGTGRYPGSQVQEFKTLVRELHKAGIKVILDVVYNHTAEGSELGPTLSFRGLDNRNYYSLTGSWLEPQRYYMNYSGCGNSLDASNPAVIRLVLDSLRYWVEVMHVDGFRFDLASVLGRSGEYQGFRGSSSFFDVVSQDPVLNRAILIAEPWDIGTYQVGNFPVDWSEWNGRFRDTLRKFGKGDPGQLPELGWRLTGSADLYGEDGRSAYNSVNFITCHDGFTLHDLVAYNGKHNEANGENNRDGSNDNASWNCGVEGETENPDVLRLRNQLARNHICHLMFSSGTPMILGGDEFLRTQFGNNNAYCQDNAISWFDWELLEKNRDIFEFWRKAIAFIRRYSILQRRKFYLGLDLNDNGVPDFSWYGERLDKPDWQNPEASTLAFQLDGSEEKSALGDYRFFVILNGDYQRRGVQIPLLPAGMRWRRAIDTSLPAGGDFPEFGQEVLLDPAEYYLANPRSTVVLVGR
jgi:glycogen operon protein